MKLFRFASVLTLLAAAAFGQVTAQCPACALGPLSYSAPVNTDSVAHGVILTNSSKNVLPMTWTVTGPGFLPGGGMTCKQGSIAPGKCTISLKFHPTVVGTVAGKLTINVSSTAITAVLLNGTPIPAPGKSVQLNWNAPASDGAASYNLYRSLPDGSYVKVGSVMGSMLTFTNTAVPSGNYSYVATTVDAQGRESTASNVVSVVIP